MFQFVAPPMPHYVTCGEDTYPPGGTHPDRSNIGVFDLIVVTKGCLYLEEERKHLHITQGTYAILRPDQSHRTSLPCQEETHFYWLHFHTFGIWNAAYEQVSYIPGEESHSYAQIEKFSIYIPQQGKLHLMSRVEEQLSKLLFLYLEQSVSAHWKQQILFQDLLSMLQNEEKSDSQSSHLKVAEQAGEFLRRHYNEPISYRRLSESLHFHPNYISLCMKRTFGCTPLEFLTRYRVEQAKQKLIHTNDPIGNIAEETGFGSFPYFIRCFTRYAGLKPKSFRLLHRK